MCAMRRDGRGCNGLAHRSGCHGRAKGAKRVFVPEVPAIPLREARCPPKRDHRDKPGDDTMERVAGFWWVG